MMRDFGFQTKGMHGQDVHMLLGFRMLDMLDLCLE